MGSRTFVITFLALAKLGIESHNFRVHHMKENIKSFLSVYETYDFLKKMRVNDQKHVFLKKKIAIGVDKTLYCAREN
jgi:hypothetical protein